jgi:hypothetical protein
MQNIFEKLFSGAIAVGAGAVILAFGVLSTYFYVEYGSNPIAWVVSFFID